MLAGLKQYDPTYTGGDTPDIGAYGGWEAANLMVEGLQVAGPNLTRQSFIDNLHNVTNWTDNGLSPIPVSFSLAGFGVAPQTGSCSRYVTFNGTAYVPYLGGKTFCGTLLPS
jgi:hypothetical protein